MYRCEDCGATFAPEDAATHKEPHRLDGQVYYEQWAACPECRGTDLEEVEACPLCGTWTYKGVCQDCRKEIRQILQKAMSLSDTKDGKEAILDEITEFLEGYET